MKKARKNIFIVIGMFLIIPITFILLFHKDMSLLYKGEDNIEWYLPEILLDVIDPDMHMETVKAQAILIRSNILYLLENEKMTFDELQKKYSDLSVQNGIKEKEVYDRLVHACEKTRGEVVLYNNELCYCPFFLLSNGTTREAFSYFEDGSYPYLIAVPSHRDEESSEYITYHHFSKEEFSEKMNILSEGTFQNQIEILEKDESEYITWIKVGDSVIGGEQFREALHLSSSCFNIEQKSDGIRIVCKGRGHGFGFSQYGANAMAIDGKNYKELIEYYFQNIEIENVYRFS